jgi:DNA-binding transcriptional LysR family regulator
MHVTLRQLRAFTAVVDTGSFSEAAKAMHLSQAALSGLIKELEGRVGVRLLDRDTRTVALSTVGAAFEPMARRVLATLDEALDSLTNLKELRRGVVRVAAPEPLSCTLLPQLISMYGGSHPGVDIRFEDVPMEQVLAALQDGSADIGFGPAGAISDEALAEHALCTDPLWVALHPDDPLAQSTSVTWKALRERPVINYMRRFSTHVLSRVPARHHPRELVAVHRVNTALSMASVKHAAAVCPAMADSLVHGFGLAFLPLKQPEVGWDIAAYVRRGASLSPAVESFLGFTLAFARTWVALAHQVSR